MKSKKSTQKKSIGFGLLSFSLLFFANPNINIIDFLPDFIGYILLCFALSRLADMNESIGEAVSSFRKMILIAWIVYFVWIILNFMLIFSCYVKICDESDVEMERKPSRFAFVNRFRTEMDRRQEKAIEESLAYRKSKQEKKRRGKK